MKLLLDTHAVIWVLEGDARVGNAAREVLLGCEPGDCAISDITLLEISMLVEKRRIEVAMPLVEYLRAIQQRCRVLPVSAEIAADAFLIDLRQGDPFDRVIVGTARHHQLVLITRDRQIADSGLCQTVWD